MKRRWEVRKSHRRDIYDRWRPGSGVTNISSLKDFEDVLWPLTTKCHTLSIKLKTESAGKSHRELCGRPRSVPAEVSQSRRLTPLTPTSSSREVKRHGYGDSYQTRAFCSFCTRHAVLYLETRDLGTPNECTSAFSLLVKVRQPHSSPATCCTAGHLSFLPSHRELPASAVLSSGPQIGKGTRWSPSQPSWDSR